jgi:hypothetical protein
MGATSKEHNREGHQRSWQTADMMGSLIDASDGCVGFRPALVSTFVSLRRCAAGCLMS